MTAHNNNNNNKTRNMLSERGIATTVQYVCSYRGVSGGLKYATTRGRKKKVTSLVGMLEATKRDKTPTAKNSAPACRPPGPGKARPPPDGNEAFRRRRRKSPPWCSAAAPDTARRCPHPGCAPWKGQARRKRPVFRSTGTGEKRMTRGTLDVREPPQLNHPT